MLATAASAAAVDTCSAVAAVASIATVELGPSVCLVLSNGVTAVVMSPQWRCAIDPHASYLCFDIARHLRHDRLRGHIWR
jgi:hypothetical protein